MRKGYLAPACLSLDGNFQQWVNAAMPAACSIN